MKFAKANLTPGEEYDERGVNTTLPRPHHPDLATVKDKHPTRALAAAIHYQLRKRMYPHFPASQTEIADLFTSVTDREYEGGQKLSKVRKLDSDKPPDTKGDKDKENNASPAKQKPPTSANDDQEIDPEMPELEDVVFFLFQILSFFYFIFSNNFFLHTKLLLYFQEHDDTCILMNF